MNALFDFIRMFRHRCGAPTGAGTGMRLSIKQQGFGSTRM